MLQPRLYSPLSDPAHEIRLLTLVPSPDSAAPINGALEVVSLDESHKPYDALSYAWGDPNITAPILLNGQEKQVTVNLQSALRHLRHESEPVTLWADAVCINQDDIAERSHQVGQMGHIYSTARSVLVWLGEEREDDDSHLVANQIASCGVGKDMIPFPPPGPEAERLLQAASQFVRRDWWSRLWVIQEVLLAEELTLCLGRRRFPEMDVWIGVSGFIIPLGRSSSDSDCSSEDTEQDAESGELPLPEPTHGRTLFSLLEAFCDRQCSQTVDRVYGLLGVADDADQYEAPDYSKSSEEVFTGVAVQGFTNQDCGPRILCFAGQGDSRSNKLKLPSWVPDWTSRRYNCLAPPTAYLPSQLQHAPEFSFSSDLATLRLRGAVFDTVASVIPIHPASQGSCLPPDRFVADGKPLLYKTGITRLEAVFRMLTHDLHLVTDKRLAKGTKYFCDAVSAFLYSLGQPNAKDDGNNPQVNGETCPDYITGFLHWLGEDRGGRSDQQILELLMGEDKSDTRRIWKRRKDEMTRGKWSYHAFYYISRTFSNSMGGGHLLETESGLFGMASSLAQKGDIVCVLFGCPMPIVMRQAGESWRIVQSCYIYGMDGETALEPQDFSII
ncbi:heterokaryon incompatibility protein-domain-containing protein [Podospora aff. communis PSN243]|uniref:Heterokaryon incompatibility protein-domain-containing protein n=1 Tax=Podospora aff. communis PSN243 TaxID=3040156 RepID=A0AAV9GCL1_9PEZI|nr:heterokaryon incompatibility protein-domain-containing protein [Podospora aff. communis PSN243]